MEEALTLDFKYLRNIMVFLGDEVQSIPMQMKEMSNPMGVVDRHTGKSTIFPIFDMDRVHKLPLLDEKLDLPERSDYGSDRDYEEECSVVYAQRREARAANDVLRAKVYHHVKRGNIEIVRDPFEKRKVKGVSVATKPSEIAKEIDATPVSKTSAKTSAKR